MGIIIAKKLDNSIECLASQRRDLGKIMRTLLQLVLLVLLLPGAAMAACPVVSVCADEATQAVLEAASELDEEARASVDLDAILASRRDDLKMIYDEEVCKELRLMSDEDRIGRSSCRENEVTLKVIVD